MSLVNLSILLKDKKASEQHYLAGDRASMAPLNSHPRIPRIGAAKPISPLNCLIIRSRCFGVWRHIKA